MTIAELKHGFGSLRESMAEEQRLRESAAGAMTRFRAGQKAKPGRPKRITVKVD